MPWQAHRLFPLLKAIAPRSTRILDFMCTSEVLGFIIGRRPWKTKKTVHQSRKRVSFKSLVERCYCILLLPGKEDIYVIDALTQILLERYAAGLGEAVGLYLPDPRTYVVPEAAQCDVPMRRVRILNLIFLLLSTGFHNFNGAL